MIPTFPVLILNIGLQHKDMRSNPAKRLSDTLYEVSHEFSTIYSCEVYPGKDEPTLVVTVSAPSHWARIIERLADSLGQDCIACYHTGEGKFLIGTNDQRLTWDDSKFVNPRIYYGMVS